MKKLFTDDRFFLAMVICDVMGAAIFKLASALSFYSVAEMCVHVACSTALYITYWKHSKNAMKGLMGALLMEQLLASISAVSSASGIDTPFAVIYMVLILALFVFHFIINSNRHPSRIMIMLNQIIAFLTALNITVWNCTLIVNNPDPTFILSTLIGIAGFIGMTCVIVCVESRLDAYRLERETAGWTEEKGYPEGYVHQFEKNDTEDK